MQNKSKTSDSLSLGELHNKRVVLYTLCGIGWLFAFTMSYLVVARIPVPESFDRLATFVFGNICGSLIQTGINRAIASNAREPMPVVNADGEPLKVEEASEAREGGGEIDPKEDSDLEWLPRRDPLSKTVLKNTQEKTP